MRNIASENNQFNFKKGATALVILALLKTGDMYGYQLSQTMDEMSGGLFTLQEGSLYPILYRLSEQGFISDQRIKVGKRMTRIYYHIEPAGLEHFKSLMHDYRMINNGVDMIINKCSEGETDG